jgi:hypothetical protein
VGDTPSVIFPVPAEDESPSRLEGERLDSDAQAPWLRIKKARIPAAVNHRNNEMQAPNFISFYYFLAILF